jgi:uncharacterized protein (DUF1330 family)
MSAYLIARVEITNPERYQDYIRATPVVIAKFGGKFIARGGKVVNLEGPEETRRVVIIEFPTLERAEAFFKSDEYKKVKQFRAGAAVGEFLLVDGVAP